MGSGNLISSGRESADLVLDTPSFTNSIPRQSLSDDEDCIEHSVLDDVKELLVNAQRFNCWNPGKGGVLVKAPTSGIFKGIPMSQVLSSGIDLWRNLEIDDDELMEIVIKDISYQIEKHEKTGKDRDFLEDDDNSLKDDGQDDENDSLIIDTPETVEVPKPSKTLLNTEELNNTQRKFNPKVDPTILYLNLQKMTFDLEDFLFRVEPKERFSVFDPVFEGFGTLVIKNTSIKMRVECRKERINNKGNEITVPVLQLQELDVKLDKVKFKFKETGADWLLNKVVQGFSANITEIVEMNLREQIISQIHQVLENLNNFIEGNPEIVLKVLGITIDDLEENIVWV